MDSTPSTLTGVLLFLRSPNVVVVHPGETATILVCFTSAFSLVINCVYVLFCFVCKGEKLRVLRGGEGMSFNARLMFGAMHKSESPSFLQTPFGFVYGEPMHVALDRLD
jgi:hypothetical protein